MCWLGPKALLSSQGQNHPYLKKTALSNQAHYVFAKWKTLGIFKIKICMMNVSYGESYLGSYSSRGHPWPLGVFRMHPRIPLWLGRGFCLPQPIKRLLPPLKRAGQRLLTGTYLGPVLRKYKRLVRGSIKQQMQRSQGRERRLAHDPAVWVSFQQKESHVL